MSFLQMFRRPTGSAEQDEGGDVTINSVKYPLLRTRAEPTIPIARGGKMEEPDTQLAWRIMGGADIQEGSAEREVVASWEFGAPAGMGETTRIGPESMGSAFTINLDTSPFGYVKLPTPAVTKAPTFPVADVPTWGIETQPTGSAEFETGSFVKDTTTGDAVSQEVDLDGTFEPVALELWTAWKTSDGTPGANAQFSRGFSDGTNDWMAFVEMEDALGTTDARRKSASGLILEHSDLDGTVQDSISVTSFDSDGFTLNIDNSTNNAYIIHFRVVGGPDVVANVKEVTLETSTGNQAVTGVGFQPDVVQFLSAAAGDESLATIAKLFNGAMDKQGNQWANAIYSLHGNATSDTYRWQTADACMLVADAAAETLEASYASMDSDGFTFNITNATSGIKVGALSIRGIQVRVGNFTKDTDTGADAQTGIGFTLACLSLFGVHNIVAAAPATGLKLVVGGASSTALENSAAINDKHNVGTTVSDGVDNSEDLGTPLIYEGLDDDGASQDTAILSVIGSDGFTLDWQINGSAAEQQILYLAMAAKVVSDTRFPYIMQGERSYKTSVAVGVGGAITIHEEKKMSSIANIGGAAEIGQPTRFEGGVYVPLGGIEKFVKLTVADENGTDSWAADGSNLALHFCVSNDGIENKLVRAYSTNLIDLSADGSTWDAANYEIGSTDTKITGLQDTGVAILVAKEDHCYRTDTSGATEQRTRGHPVGVPVENAGVGLSALPRSVSAYYNRGGELLLIGPDDAVNVSPNRNPLNRPIPNLTHEPVNVSHYEVEMGSDDWQYGAMRVTEDGVTRTYIGAALRNGSQLTWHTEWAFDTWCRLAFVDSRKRLWFVKPGAIGYWQLGTDGGPDAGRDSPSYSSVSGGDADFGPNPAWKFPATDFGLPTTTKQLRSIEIDLLGAAGASSFLVGGYSDDAAAAAIAGSIVTDGVTKKYFGDATTCIKFRPFVHGSLLNFSGAPDSVRIYKVVVRAVPRPDRANEYEFIINTRAKYTDNSTPPDEAEVQRSTLAALVNAAPVAFTFSGDTGTFMLTDVADLDVRAEPNMPATWVIQCRAKDWKNA